jgi:hypothetical protein
VAPPFHPSVCPSRLGPSGGWVRCPRPDREPPSSCRPAVRATGSGEAGRQPSCRPSSSPPLPDVPDGGGADPVAEAGDLAVDRGGSPRVGTRWPGRVINSRRPAEAGRPDRAGWVVQQRRATSWRCQRRIVPGGTSSPRRRRTGSGRVIHPSVKTISSSCASEGAVAVGDVHGLVVGHALGEAVPEDIQPAVAEDAQRDGGSCRRRSSVP